jgi:polyphosphate kinase 2 (PPK2 family)
VTVFEDPVPDYQDALGDLHKRLRLAQIAIYRQNRKAIIVLEGYDAAGKGGVIRELSYAWDPRGFEVYPIGPPSAEEGSHPFMWRFWNRLPGPGQIAVFDRSWYGRLLVERGEHGLSDSDS